MPNSTSNDGARDGGVSGRTGVPAANKSPLSDTVMRARVERVIAELDCLHQPPAPLPAPPPAAAEARAPNAPIALVYDRAAEQLALGAQQGAIEALGDSGHALVIHAIDRDAPAMAADWHEYLDAIRPAGVLLLPGAAEIEPIARACSDWGIDYVRIGAGMIDRPARLITSNDREAAAEMTGYLIALGHQRIGFVTGRDEPGAAQERELGYLDAMADHDLDRGPALIAGGDGSFASGIEAGGLLLEVSPSPTAIFAANDTMAAGVLHAARARGIAVPEHLSILGFDDTAIAAQLWPPLTTVRLPIAAMARAAACRLIGRGTEADRALQFETEPVLRASVGPAS